MLIPVSTIIGYLANKAHVEFGDFVLGYLLDMSLMVQGLSGDRLIHIQIPVGKSFDMDSLYWLFGLITSWVIRAWFGLVCIMSTKNIQFGGSGAADEETSITMLDAQGKHLLIIKPRPDGDDTPIGAVRTNPTRGWGVLSL